MIRERGQNCFRQGGTQGNCLTLEKALQGAEEPEGCPELASPAKQNSLLVTLVVGNSTQHTTATWGLGAFSPVSTCVYSPVSVLSLCVQHTLTHICPLSPKWDANNSIPYFPQCITESLKWYWMFFMDTSSDDR